ncbi:hypothetical protein SARC_06987 [Sphaeroforma arctica JP610]|uniref:Uncharacterized protein n=1 Tax=Sphaeroforma arctica JP610 TaxID=667725 RepID=A0A0L0FXJ6_9EUKA|nr:hypothetical protein SARC_06987 [Sphaeroforma arctica JP610]KNC80673.1 hypothetical protein SARC_06987 [Sphaeroforma arctica JP610]|eukprot:XP_014154575.1 hypothetical protein SARC_06987 [Sphaeroforma arctica JP610]
MIMLQSGDLHVSKNVKKKGKKYRLTIDTAFDEIIRRCHAYHDSCWLRKPLVDAFRKLHVALPSCFPIQEDKPNAKDKTIHKHTHTQTHTQTPQNPSPDRMDINTAQINSRDKIRVRTIELWDKNGEHLVAGEIGYTLGRTYTSLSGFTCESGSGTVQCIALGRLLERCGYTYWDLGMSMAYKLSMGAKNLPRLKFLDRLAEERDKEPEKSITCMLGTKANDIIAK